MFGVFSVAREVEVSRRLELLRAGVCTRDAFRLHVPATDADRGEIVQHAGGLFVEGVLHSPAGQSVL